MKNNRTIGMVSAAALLVAAGTVQAEETWYAAFSLGSGNASIDEGVVAVTGATASAVTQDKRDPGFKVLLGRRFGRYFAVEGGYTHLGEFRASRDITAPVAGAVNADIRIKGLHVDAVGVLPLGAKFAVSASLGVLLSETKTFRVTSGAATPILGAGSRINDEINPHFSLGLRYELGPKISFRAEWDRYVKVGDANTTGEIDVDLYSVGLQFRF